MYSLFCSVPAVKYPFLMCLILITKTKNVKQRKKEKDTLIQPTLVYRVVVALNFANTLMFIRLN